MLTFEKVLKVFQAYLDDDPLYEVVQTSHGYTLMAWEPHRNDWYSAEIQKTPEDLRNALLGTYANFLEDKITGNDRTGARAHFAFAEEISDFASGRFDGITRDFEPLAQAEGRNAVDDAEIGRLGTAAHGNTGRSQKSYSPS